MQKEIRNRLRKIIAEESGAEEKDILDETCFSEDLAIQSLLFIKILVVIEETFQIELSEEDVFLEEELTFGQLAQIVIKKISLEGSA